MSDSTKRRLKQLLIVGIIIVTFVVFYVYIKNRPELLGSLFSLGPLTVLALTVGYLGFTLANSFVLFYSLKLIDKKVPFIDNVLLTGYSSIVNFFGPLQSGPGFRAVYLKKKYGVKLRDFFVTTVIFYGFFGLINVSVLLVAAIGRFQSPGSYIVLGLVCTAGVMAIYWVVRKNQKLQAMIKKIRLNNKNFWLIGLGAMLLVGVVSATYYAELLHVNSDIEFWQAFIYSAAANLALFVSLTPGAIGFRESFLLFSQQLHGIDTSTVIAASVIDRAFYVGFLLVLFVILILINTRYQFLSHRTK